MIVNGNRLLSLAPIKDMLTFKVRGYIASHGLSEAGYDIRIKQGVWLHPFKRFSLASTVEEFDMPNTLVGVVHDKSTWIRKGVMVGNSVVEGGWKGFLTLELTYHRWWPIYIPAGSGIAQVLFTSLSEPASYAGKYQFQPDRPVEAING